MYLLLDLPLHSYHNLYNFLSQNKHLLCKGKQPTIILLFMYQPPFLSYLDILY